MAVAKKVKVHTSALCWIPPIAQQEAIQALRAEFDRQIDRWPPHVNLLYPFVPVSEFQLAAAMLASALARLPPFSVNMQRLQHFKHSQKSFTAWLDPDGALEQWQALQSCCMAVLPHCVDQTARGAFVPHLTVGQFTGASDVEALRARIEHSFEPLACQVGEIALISRAGQNEPFLVHWRVPLGGGEAHREDMPHRGIFGGPGAFAPATEASAAAVSEAAAAPCATATATPDPSCTAIASGYGGHVQSGAQQDCATDRAVRASAAADGMREISVASSEAFTSVVTEQTTGGKVWDAAVHLLGYLEAHPHYLVGRPAVLECGAGTGWLGMSLAARHDLSEMVLTEMVQGGALRWLDYNVQRNRDAGVPLTTVRTAALDWAWMDQGAHHGACRPAACVELLSTRWDLVLGSDLVYNEAGVSMLPRVLAALAQPRTRILYAHTFNRFEFLDCDFLKALRAQGLRYREVWPSSGEGSEPAHGTLAAPRGDAEANADGSECSFTGELFPELRLAVLLITREDQGSRT